MALSEQYLEDDIHPIDIASLLSDASGVESMPA